MISVDEFIARFQLELRDNLPGERAHKSMLPSQRKISSLAIKEASKITESAVAIILFPLNDTIHCLLTQRPEYEGSHSGQVSFPGGKFDVMDLNLEFTARRECFEEVGIPENQGILLGQMTDVFIPVSGFLMKPFVFFHKQLPRLIRNEREVAEIFSFSLFDLKNEELVSEMDLLMPNGISFNHVPYFNIHDKKVWGATAFVLSEIRELIKDFD